MPTHIFKNPIHYSKNNALQYNFAMKMLSKMVFHDNSRILDIGCGDGVITHEMAQISSIGCVLGTDISADMVDFASKKYTNQHNLLFLRMDACRTIFRDQFDIITSFNCLHWVADQKSAIEGIAKAAAEGAQIALLLSHRKSEYHYVLEKLCSQSKWKSYFVDYTNPRSFFDISTYETLLKQAGLVVDSLEEERMTYFYNNTDELKQFFSAAGSQIKAIPSNLKECFLTDFVNLYLNEVTVNKQNEIPLSFWCLQVLAKKPLEKKTTLQNQKVGSLKLFSKL